MHPEWPLVKVTIIPGFQFPVAVTMEGFPELGSGFSQPAKVLRASFQSTRLYPIGPIGHQVRRQAQEQILPELVAQFEIAGLANSVAVLAQGIDRALKAHSFQIHLAGGDGLGDQATN